MRPSDTNWKAAAAYLYVLRLNDAELSWEYMRRKSEFPYVSMRVLGPLQACVRKRPGRIALMHMRVLQALDGVDAGASHREIASAIFGADIVAARWHADSELRARVRHLIRRGRELTSTDHDEPG